MNRENETNKASTTEKHNAGASAQNSGQRQAQSNMQTRAQRPAQDETAASSLSFYVTTKPLRLFFMMALPGAVSMLASILYQFLDGVFVGRILGNEAFAALNLVFPLVIINFALADLVGVGSAVPISIGLGRKEEKEANNIFSCACLMIVVSGAVIGALLFFLAPPLVAFMGAEGTFAQNAVAYLRVYAICSPVTTIVFAMDNYLKICGRIKTSMTLNIVMSFLGAAFEFAFLYVFRWGIWGAAAGTCLAMFICAAIAFALFASGTMQLRFCRPKFSRKILLRILSCGAPTFLSNISGRVTAILTNMLLVRFGGAGAVSIYGMLMYADSFIISLIYGTSDSLQPAVGYNYGAGKRERVRAIEACCFANAAIISVVGALALVLFPELIVSMFIKDVDAQFVRASIFALRLFCLCYITRWFSFSTQSYMLAIGKHIYATAISVCQAFVFPIVLLAALYPAGLTGIWLNQPLTALLAAVLSVFVLARNRRADAVSGCADKTDKQEE